MTNSRWPFLYARHDAMITLKRIIAGESPILLVTHDADGGYQFLDGDDYEDDDAAVVALEAMLKHDPTRAEIACLPPGFYATREKAEDPWRVWPRDEGERG